MSSGVKCTYIGVPSESSLFGARRPSGREPWRSLGFVVPPATLPGVASRIGAGAHASAKVAARTRETRIRWGIRMRGDSRMRGEIRESRRHVVSLLATIVLEGDPMGRIASLLLVLLLSAPGSALAASFDSLISFGDSLSDTGSRG